MVITELYIRNFGKLSDRHFYFRDGLQVVSGDNETGKTTLHAFIRAMLFGLERGRGRAAADDDFSRYEPWDNPGVYGGVMRFICGGRRFRLERDFARYTKRTSLVCEDDGEELSVENGDLKMLLGNLTAGVFDGTVSIGQMKAEPGRELADVLSDHAANYYETGGGEYDLTGAFRILQERLRDAEKELRVETGAEEERLADLQREIRYVEQDVRRLEEEYREKKKELEQETAREAPERDAGKAPRAWLAAVPGMALILAGAAASAAGMAPAFLIAGVILLFAGIWWNRRAGWRGKADRIPAGSPEEADGPGRLVGELAHIRGEYRDKKLRCENLREQYGETGKSGRRRRLEERCRALSLAADKLREAADASGDEMERRLNGRMSEIFARITDGRYRSVEAGRTKNGFRITVWDGVRRIPAGRLSRGTLEQIYFALRMAAADVLLDEPFPVILDDVFAFYDDKRLESVLQWLSREKKQVILLTCQSREERMIGRNDQ